MASTAGAMPSPAVSPPAPAQDRGWEWRDRTAVLSMDGKQAASAWSAPWRADEPLDHTGRVPRQNDWRAHLAYLAEGSGVWVTSNAAYRQPGEPPEYAMGYRLGPAGLTVTGCLWGRDEGRTPVFWQFFSGWDPVAGKVMNYQAAPSGTVGIGHETFEGDVAVSDQIFVAADGTRSESRHTAVQIDRDTYETTSFARDGGAWVKRRSYRWIRQPAGAALPCAAG